MARRTFGFARLLLLLIILHIAARIGLSHELKKMTAGVRKKCLKEIGLEEAVIDDMEIGIFDDNDQKLKCYFKCALEKFNMFTKDGKLNFKLMKKTVPDHFRHIGNEMIDSCNHMAGPERCELSYEFMKCLYNANPVAFFVI